MEVAERIRAEGASLTGAERRVAEAILRSPQAVGFGTVAELARAAGVGAATVVRLSAKLGFDGFTELQTCVQRDLMSQLRPAAERIREPSADARASHAEVELANVRNTLEAIVDATFDDLMKRIVDPARPVAMLSGDDSAGVADQFVLRLQQLRSGISVLAGSQVAVRRDIALLDPATTVIVIDLRRYERWVLDAHDLVVERGIWSAAISDSPLSPISTRANVAFDVFAGSVSPFDSHVGTLALLNLVVASASTALRESGGDRLAAIEATWRAGRALVAQD
ncbi:MAG TPA: MurR/RpiR family transcriptional regulator [Ilumatobacter sp.]|nr:MurR/RpiR family transcriptional regulator [Ilumatobacter sp.]